MATKGSAPKPEPTQQLNIRVPKGVNDGFDKWAEDLTKSSISPVSKNRLIVLALKHALANKAAILAER